MKNPVLVALISYRIGTDISFHINEVIEACLIVDLVGQQYLLATFELSVAIEARENMDLLKVLLHRVVMSFFTRILCAPVGFPSREFMPPCR